MKVAIVTGASHGIGAGLVAGFRAAGYAVVGTARSIDPSDDPELLAVPGDIAEPGTAERVTVDQVRSSRAMVLDALLSSTSLLDVKIGVDHESPLA